MYFGIYSGHPPTGGLVSQMLGLGEWRCRLKSAHYTIVAQGGNYTTYEDCLHTANLPNQVLTSVNAL